MVLEKYLRKERTYSELELVDGTKMKLIDPSGKELKLFYTEYQEKLGNMDNYEMCAVVLKLFLADSDVQIAKLEDLREEIENRMDPIDTMRIVMWFFEKQGINMKEMSENMDFRSATETKP